MLNIVLYAVFLRLPMSCERRPTLLSPRRNRDAFADQTIGPDNNERTIMKKGKGKLIPYICPATS